MIVNGIGEVLLHDTGLDAATVAAIVGGSYGDPFAVLGMHRVPGRQSIAVRAMLPRARRVHVIDAADGTIAAELAQRDPAGLFAGIVQGRRKPFPYRLRVTASNGEFQIEDPYCFPPILRDADLLRFAEGEHFQVQRLLGAHIARIDDVVGAVFAVWAPNARRVSVVGPFNAWDGRCHPMRLRRECGIWEIFIPGLAPGELYKYEIVGAAGNLLPLKADPCGVFVEPSPGTASIIYDLGGFDWRDQEWLAQRAERGVRQAPIAIYEVHLGSWKRHADGTYLTYRELADELIPYVRDLGFTHIELLPISEYPFDGSWGYQPLGLFAPTSRFGKPDDFRHFVEMCHLAGIGVFIDWVPGHFPSDPHGLGYFDGTHLYEHADPRQGHHPDWDTLIYNFGRREVAAFLISNALFWIDEFHIDGLRVDAVASMLYLDYSRKPGEWLPNQFGGRENLEALAFLRRLNEVVYAESKGAITIAEESTAWPMVSRPTYLGGVGFGYKWNMGWMHDTLLYMARDPAHRRYHHDNLTFGLLYAFSENFVLPLSHDEVAHGKGSLFGKMPGDRWQKFANLRLYFAFLYSQPGKKLLFMGGEFAQRAEWNHDRGLEWELLNEPEHAGVKSLVTVLNRLYRQCAALHEFDCEGDGFEWIDCQDSDQSVITYLRFSSGRRSHIVVACNFTPVVRYGYRVGVPAVGAYREMLNTDSDLYGGSGVGNLGRVVSESKPWHGRTHSLLLTLPPLGAVMLEPEIDRRE